MRMWLDYSSGKLTAQGAVRWSSRGPNDRMHVPRFWGMLWAE